MKGKFLLLVIPIFFTMSCQIIEKWGEIPTDVTNDILLRDEVYSGWYKTPLQIFSVKQHKLFKLYQHNQWLRELRWSEKHNFVAFYLTRMGKGPDTACLLDIKKRQREEVCDTQGIIYFVFYCEERQQYYVLEKSLDNSKGGSSIAVEGGIWIRQIHLPEKKLEKSWRVDEWIPELKDSAAEPPVTSFFYHVGRGEFYIQTDVRRDEKEKSMLIRFNIKNEKVDIFRLPDSGWKYIDTDDEGRSFFYDYYKGIFSYNNDFSQYQQLAKFTRPLNFCCFSPDRKRIAGFSYDERSLYLIDLKDGKDEIFPLPTKVAEMDW